MDKKSYIVLIDFNNFMFKSLHGVAKYTPLKSKQFKIEFAKKMIREMMYVKTRFNYKIKDIIVLYDYKNWRLDEQIDYKGDRKKNRNDSKIDFDYFFKFVDTFRKEMEEALPSINVRLMI